MKHLLIVPQGICWLAAMFVYAIYEIFDFLAWKFEQLLELLGGWTNDLYNVRKKIKRLEQ